MEARGRNLKKLYQKVFLIVLIIFLLVAFSVLFRIRGSVSLRPEKDCRVPESVVCNFQKDPLWERDKLGTSAYTMGSSGCLTTCLTSIIDMQNIGIEQVSDGITPGTMNTLFSNYNVYDNDGNIQWGQLESLLNVSIMRKQASELGGNEIDTLLEQKCYPIVRVRVAGFGSYHFVLIVGAQDGEYLCMDPLNEKGEIVPLSKFWNRIYAVRYIKGI